MPHIKKSLDTFFRTYPAFLSHLQNNSHSNAKAEGLAKMMMELNTVAFAALIQDLIGPLSRLSTSLQGTDVSLADAIDMIDTTKEVLQLFKTAARSSETLTGIVREKTVSGFKLKAKGPTQNMAVLRDQIVDGLVHNISRRFSSKEDWMKSTVISSLRNWPQESQNELNLQSLV